MSTTWPQFDSSCDWGECDERNVGYRNDIHDCGWVLVCQTHYDAELNKENVGRFITEAEAQLLQSRLSEVTKERDDLRNENELAEKVFKFILPNRPMDTISELAKPVLDEVDRLRNELSAIKGAGVP